MPKWTNAGSGSVCLVADPNQLAAPGKQGNLKLDYQNYSFMPLTIAVLRLGSSNPTVAAPNTPPPPTINISVPRRPNRHSARTPAKGSMPVGTWSSLSHGSATLNADVDVQNMSGQRLSAVTPSDDVQVT